MEPSINPGHSRGQSTDEELLIDLSPSALNRSLRGEQSVSNNDNSTEDEDDSDTQARISTPIRKIRRSKRTVRQQREMIPTDTELSEPLTQSSQNNSVTEPMKLMMEQMAQTMKAMQNMMEATTQTLRQVSNQTMKVMQDMMEVTTRNLRQVNSQTHTTDCELQPKISRINSNNNKSETGITESHHEESNEDSEKSENEQSINSTATRDLFKSTESYNHKLDCKLPPYTGSEKWRVWLNRFESVAKLAKWTAKEKLQQILPRIQGIAADFVFGQLKKETIGNYETLVAEIESRFGTLENKRVYKTQFNNKRQGKDESLEEYAADIKRLYDWAHPSRDASTRQEDLISKFLQGLWDSKARQYIELHKEPSTIEEAVQQVAAYMSVTSNLTTNEERHTIRQAKPYGKGDNHYTGKGNTNSVKMTKGNCFICNMPGHYARECPNRNFHRTERSQYRKPPENTMSSSLPNIDEQPKTNQSQATSTMSPDAPEFQPSRQSDESGEKIENQGKSQPYVRDVSREEELSAQREYIRRQFLKADGIYVQGTIQGIKVEFTADTGAARTILSDKIFWRLPGNERPELKESSSLVAVNGDPLKVLGKAEFAVQLGNLAFQREIIVAGIEDECLLGMDILLDSQFGPAVINLNDSFISMNGCNIPFTKESRIQDGAGRFVYKTFDNG
ncbi:uncharacterized protein LOC134235877 [Saccostrea cucullata]|uniref:uncharacterized protein LOC134235877 n=1 Tax=Saccostrea cuccullata TaxID=36930 RepID=UPI002ED01E42